MASEETIKSFLVDVGFNVQSESEGKFISAIDAASEKVEKLGAFLEGTLLSAGKLVTGLVAAGTAFLVFAEQHNAAMRQMELGAQFANTTIQHMEDEAYALTQVAGWTKEAGRSLVESFGAWAQSKPNEVGFLGSMMGIKNYSQTDTALQLKDIANYLAHVAKTDGIAVAIARGKTIGLSEGQVFALIAQGNSAVDFSAQGAQINQNFGIDMKKDAEAAHEFMTIWNKLTEDFNREENHFVAMLDRAGLTKHLEDLSKWVDTHGDVIDATLVKIANDMLAAVTNIINLSERIYNTWESLTPGEREWTEQLAKLLLAVMAFRKAPFLFGTIAVGELIGDFQGLADGTKNWHDALSDLLTISVEAWAAGLLAPLGKVLKFLRWIPGSGVTAATLEGLGLGGAAGAVAPALPLASDTPQGPEYKEAPGGEWFGNNGPVARWFKHLFGGGGDDTTQPPPPNGIPSTGPAFGPQVHEEAFHTFGEQQVRAQEATYRTFLPQQQQRGTPGDAHTADMLMKFFESQGWTHAQASGIVGNLQAESALNPNAVNPTGHIGLAQWDQHRQELYARLFGHRMDDPSLSHIQALAEQAEFIQWELTHTEAAAGQLLGASNNFAQAADAFNKGYERSGTGSGQRAGFAGDEYNRTTDPFHLHEASRYLQPAPQVHVTVQVQQAAAKGGPPINQTISNTIYAQGDTGTIGNAVFNAHNRANASLVRYARGAIV